MGAVMLLKTGNSQVRFKPRTIEVSTSPQAPRLSICCWMGSASDIADASPQRERCSRNER